MGTSIKELNCFSQDIYSIQSLYRKVMRGFDEGCLIMTAESEQNGYYHNLCAPGYEENGIGEIVAQCK